MFLNGGFVVLPVLTINYGLYAAIIIGSLVTAFDTCFLNAALEKKHQQKEK